MASKSQSKPFDDLDNYGVEDNFSDDPFRSPSPQTGSKKRKAAPTDSLGLDEEIDLTKKARKKAPKLDEERLLSEAGIPELRKRAKKLKFKGKGHEWTDASRLLSFYQLWLDDLFPKARFLDALAMIEKTGHKRAIDKARSDWMEESRPTRKEGANDDADLVDIDGLLGSNQETSKSDGQGHTQPPGRKQKTPERDQDVPDDDDLYGATPKRSLRMVDVPDEDDDLDAMMAEAEARDSRPAPQRPLQQNDDEPDGDDLDALMAESEVRDKASKNTRAVDKPAASAPEPDSEDGLDTLITEAEDQDEKAHTTPNQRHREEETRFADDEAAMQEMEGLW